MVGHDAWGSYYRPTNAEGCATFIVIGVMFAAAGVWVWLQNRNQKH